MFIIYTYACTNVVMSKRNCDIKHMVVLLVSLSLSNLVVVSKPIVSNIHNVKTFLQGYSIDQMSLFCVNTCFSCMNGNRCACGCICGSEPLCETYFELPITWNIGKREWELHVHIYILVSYLITKNLKADSCLICLKNCLE